MAEEGQRPRGAPEHLGKVAEHVGSPAIRRHVRTWEREADVARVQARLDLSKGSTLLVGGPGSGKTAVLVDAARKVERELGLGPGEARSSVSGSPAGRASSPGSAGWASGRSSWRR